ncbi:sulfotransferase [Solwaraspora sp. WMMD937]|uniref:sulfotransferase n=1 Tax=Solwaraspora sp. WMMD937 TaxID=3016090 RepID=UPI00249C6435|nr:sulfotransferase [Solwaraspora sp. WMMD937]WFE21456.1 sulfotransferase [Solwaraspora sp. WMMD937]
MRLCYIGGIGRSGSTLIERVLNELPGVCGLGEVAQVWDNGVRDNRLCGCGAAFRDCPLWSRIGEYAFGGWDNVDPARIARLRAVVGRTRHVGLLAAPWLGERRRDRVIEYVDYHARIYAAAAAVTGARVVVDSSKDTALAYGLRWAGPADLRILHLVRDPRGVAYSWMRRVHDPESGTDVAVPRFPAARCALTWSGHNAAYDLLGRLGRRRHGAVGGRLVHRMRYEEFLADPLGTAGTLSRLAGLPQTGLDLSYLSAGEVELGELHSVSGNRMRFTTGRLRLRVDDAWRTGLPVAARRTLTGLCAPLLRRYGYHRPLPPDPSAPATEAAGAEAAGAEAAGAEAHHRLKV